MKEDNIRVLKVEPQKEPEVVTLKNDLEAMQEADAAAAKAPTVDTGAASADVSTTRKRARFQSGGSTIQAVSI